MSRILSLHVNHVEVVIIHLGRPLLDASSSYLRTERAALTSDNRCLYGSGSCLAPGGVYLAGCVTTAAGALLPHPFTLTRLPGRSTLCCTFPRVAPGCR